MEIKDKLLLAIFEHGGTIEAAVKLQPLTNICYITINKYLKMLETEGMLNRTRNGISKNISLTLKGMEKGQKLKELRAI